MALDREKVIAAAVELLDEGGLDGLTLRRLADRLGVRAPTLYWHVKDKAALITALAEAILSDLRDLRRPAAGEQWDDWLVGVAERLRAAMIAHPDGARVVSAAPLSETLAAVSELAIRSLFTHGLPLRQARLTVLVMVRFTIGHVLDEQSPRPADPFDVDAFTERHPTLVAAIGDYLLDGRTADDLFRDAVRVIVSR
ncbi:TetR/AcrR family transcriptional regulator C-terminal domain-containing protein [Actinoplanes sp. NPDC048988]|uniref:TetR/AcrR family transcriptional regulator C-terminal domain-containing protein n=1 Tax=Actinoplanes sp. NPDC048988 TaxID=3363901 RepID=UPI00371168A2